PGPKVKNPRAPRSTILLVGQPRGRPQMSSSETAAPDDTGAAGPSGAPVFDVTVARLLDAVPSGSYLALTRMGSDLLDEETQNDLEGMQDRMMRRRFTSRTREQVARFFDGTDLVDPGLVRVEEWRAEPAAGTTDRSPLWCAVGRKR